MTRIWLPDRTQRWDPGGADWPGTWPSAPAGPGRREIWVVIQWCGGGSGDSGVVVVGYVGVVCW